MATVDGWHELHRPALDRAEDLECWPKATLAGVRVIFETERLRVRVATADDAPLIHELWTSPEVMRNVGYPEGLAVTLDDIRERIVRDADVLDALLVVETKDGLPIGQCLARRPNQEGVAETDIKLLPSHWGRRYGIEVKQGLVDYLFTHTDCLVVEATPNVGNTASIRMQAAVGGIRVGEGMFESPGAAPVHHYVYRVARAAWRSRQG